MGEIDKKGNVDPYKLTFSYKTGFKDNLNGEDFKPPRKNVKKNKEDNKDCDKLSSLIKNKEEKFSSHITNSTY